MNFSKLIKFKPQEVSDTICKNLYKGACVKIRNSQKTYQVIGINPKNHVCWIREWPYTLDANFALQINQITLQSVCTQKFSEKLFS